MPRTTTEFSASVPPNPNLSKVSPGTSTISRHDWSSQESPYTSRPQLLVNDGTGDPNFELTPSITSLHEECPWRLKALLSLDGGGVRGLSSLIILDRIMTYVSQYEEKKDRNARGSAYSPLFDSSVGDSATPGFDEQDSQKYLPCHYFDYIGGTSTGSLIAIMLGRLKMSVDEAMEEYQEMSKNVFEKPSSRLKRFLNNYDRGAGRQKLRDKIEDLASRHPERALSNEPQPFKSDPQRCRTIVCSIKRTQDSAFQEPFLFRSYESSREIREQTQNSVTYLERNPSNSQSFKIWEVAKVSSAAPSFFKSVDLEDSKYYDAVVNMNNPSWILLNEVHSVVTESHDKLDTLLSIGGGNAKKTKSKAESRTHESLTDSIPYSEYVDQKVRKESKLQGFSYQRFDVEGGLRSIRLDEWKPKHSGKITLEKLRTQTEVYLGMDKVASQCRILAESLVERRISRSKTMLWESFAAGTRYRCPLGNCSKECVLFLHRNELMDHLRSEHKKASPDTEHYEEIQTLLDQGRTNSG